MTAAAQAAPGAVGAERTGARPYTVDIDIGGTLTDGLFSDGVSDAWPDGEAAERGLLELVRTHAPAGAAALTAAIFAHLHERRPEAGDDRALLVVRRVPC